MLILTLGDVTETVDVEICDLIGKSNFMAGCIFTVFYYYISEAISEF